MTEQKNLWFESYNLWLFIQFPRNLLISSILNHASKTPSDKINKVSFFKVPMWKTLEGSEI